MKIVICLIPYTYVMTNISVYTSKKPILLGSVHDMEENIILI